MPGAGVGLVEDFYGGHAHAEGEVCGEGFGGFGACGLGGGDVCAVALEVEEPCLATRREEP